jgi:hypothetical protein
VSGLPPTLLPLDAQPQAPPQMPQNPRETEKVLEAMRNAVQQEVLRQNQLFAQQIDAAGPGAQQALQQQQLLKQQAGQQRLNELTNFLTTDLQWNDPGTRDWFSEQIEGLPHYGLTPDQVAPLRQSFTQGGALADALQEDIGSAKQILENHAREGTLVRELAALGRGVMGVVPGLRESRPEAIQSFLQSKLEESFKKRFPKASGADAERLPTMEMGGRTQETFTPMEGNLEAQGIDPSHYLQPMGQAVDKLLQAAAPGMEETFGEKAAGSAGSVLGMMPLFKGIFGGGKLVGQAATGLGRKFAGQTGKIMELGVAKTPMGAALQQWGGAGTVLFGLEAASPLDRGTKERIEGLPEERRGAATTAAHIENGVRGLLQLPIMLGAGKVGEMAPAGLKAIASAGAFQVGGELPGLAEMGAKKGLAKLSPEFAEQMRLGIISNEDLRGPLVRFMGAASEGDWPTAWKEAKDVSAQFLGSAAGFGALHMLDMAGAMRDRSQLRSVMAGARFEALKATEKMAEDPAVQAELKSVVNAVADRNQPTSSERAAEKLRSDLSEATGGKGEQAVAERLELERLPLGEKKTFAERRQELATLRKAAEEKGDTAEAERISAGEQYVRLTQIAETAKEPGLARLEAQGWLEHFQALSKGQESVAPTPESIAAMGPRHASLEAARELRLDVGSPRAAREILAERQAMSISAPSNEGAKPDTAPQGPAISGSPEPVSYQKSGFEVARLPESSEEIAAQMQVRRSLEEHAKRAEGELAAFELHPGKTEEAIAQAPALKADLEAARKRFPQRGRARVAAEALYTHLRRQAGHTEPPRESAGAAIQRLHDEHQAVLERAADTPDLLAAWTRHRYEDLHGPLGVVMTRYGPGKELLDRIYRSHESQVLEQANASAGPYTMGLLPFGDPVGPLRDLMLGLADEKVLARIKRWTEQVDLPLTDPKYLSRFGLTAADFVKGVTPSITKLLARGTKVFEHPMSEFGELPVHAALAYAQGQLLARHLRKWLFDPKTGILPTRGITESELPAEIPKEGIKPDRNNPSHRLGMMLEEGPGSEVWKGAPENLQEAAAFVRPLLEELRQLAFYSTPKYHRLRESQEAAARIQTAAERELERVLATREDRLAAGSESDLVQAAESGLGAARERVARFESKAKTIANRIKKLKRAGLDPALEIARRDENTRLMGEARADVARYKQDRLAAYDAAGLASPYKLDPQIKAIKAKITRQVAIQRKLQMRVEKGLARWGFKEGYFTHVPLLSLDLGDFKPKAAGKTTGDRRSGGPVESVRSAYTLTRKGRLKASGNVDPDVFQSLGSYINGIVPQIALQKLLTSKADQIHGTWREASAPELLHGVDPQKLGNKQHAADLYLTAQYTQSLENGEIRSKWRGNANIYDGMPVSRVLGTYVEKDGAFEKAKEGGTGERVVLVWGGDPKVRPMVSDAKEVARTLGFTLHAVPQRIAQDSIRIRDGGFKHLASPGRYESLKEYFDVLAKARREAALGKDPLDMMGQRALRWFDDSLRHFGYWTSTNALGWLNPQSAANAFTGAMFINSLLLGPQRAATALRYWPQYVSQMRKVGLTGDPVEDLALHRIEGSEDYRAFRLRAFEKLKEGVDPYVGEAFVWLTESGLLSNTRGTSAFDRIAPFKSRLEPIPWSAFDKLAAKLTGKELEGYKGLRRRYATKTVGVEKVKEAAKGVMEAGWSLFAAEPGSPAALLGTEGYVRVSLGVESYVAARKAGKSEAEARDISAKAVVLSQGVFNPAFRSRFFRSGIGHWLGTVNTWSSQMVGVFNRLPLRERAHMAAAMWATAAVFAHWGLDWISALGVPPETAEDIDAWVGSGIQSDVSNVVGTNLRHIPVLGKAANDAASSWFGGALGAVFPTGIPVPNFMTTADSPVVDLLELGWQGLTDAVAGRSSGMAENLGNMAAKAVTPATLEWMRRAYEVPGVGGATEIKPGKPEEGYTYKPLGSTFDRTLYDHGLSQLVKDFLPGQVMSQARQSAFIESTRMKGEGESKMRSDVMRDLVDAKTQLIRLGLKRKAALSDPALEQRYQELLADDRDRGTTTAKDLLASLGHGQLSAESDQLVGEYKEAAKRYREAGGELDASIASQVEDRATLRALGLGVVEAAIYRHGRKVDQMEALAKLAEDRNIKVTPAQWRQAEAVLMPKKPSALQRDQARQIMAQMGIAGEVDQDFAVWALDLQDKTPSVPRDLLRRYVLAKKKASSR